MTNFLAGLAVGAFGTYALLLYACHRAAERFVEVVKEEVDRA